MKSKAQNMARPLVRSKNPTVVSKAFFRDDAVDGRDLLLRLEKDP
jgi:hypothetical protein